MKGLNSLNSWAEESAFSASQSAQGYLNANHQSLSASGFGTSCGSDDDKKESDDDTKEKPAACGTSCGAGDEEKEKSPSCGTSCGAGEK